MLRQVAANQLRPALFLEIEFLTETVYLWNGFGPKTAPGPAEDPTASFPYGESFIGMGWMGEIRSVPQVADVVAENITLTLSGIPPELVGDAINAVRQNSVATLWFGCLDGNGNVIGDPVQIFQGSLDVPTITEGAATASISITAENPLIDLNRAPSRRFTDIDQQFDYPGDTGFAMVQLLQDYNLTWPAPANGNSDTSGTQPPNFLTIAPGQDAPVPLAVGGTVTLVPTVTANDGSTYSGVPGGCFYSSDPSIATVNDSGVVTGVAPGMCVITKRYVLDIYNSQGQGWSSNGPPGQAPNNAGSATNNITASVTVIVTP
jgi:hypothetical protein